MKIVIVNQPQDSIAAAEEQRGSVAIVNWELARQLAKSHQVVIYAPWLPGQALRETWEGIEIRRVRWVAKRFHKGMQLLVGRLIPHGQYFDSRLYFREYYSQLIRELRGQAPDVVHLPQQLQFVPLLRRKLPRTKIVVHMHQDELASLDHAPLQERLQCLDAVVTVSDYVTARARARFPQFASRIHTIGNGVDVDRFRPEEDRPTDGITRLLFVGRISPDKGVHLLIDAFNALARERSDVHLTIVGKAGMLPFDILRLLLTEGLALESLREFYGRSLSGWLTHEVFGQKTSYLDLLRRRLSPQAAERVRFTGAISMQELIRTYQQSDLLVLPSIWQESYGLPIAEAMACGTAVLASRCGGVPELVDDGVTGKLVPQCNLDALTTALRNLTDDKPALRQMGRAARERATTLLTWKRSATRLEHIYEGLLGPETPGTLRRKTLLPLVVLAASATSPATAQTITQDVIIDHHFPEGEPLEKAIDYFASTSFPSVVIGNVHGGIYLYRSVTDTIKGPWQRSDIIATGGAYERARSIQFPGDAYPGLVASIGNQILLFENPKNAGGDAASLQRPWPNTVINSDHGCHDLRIEDVDGDHKLDVICSGAVNLRGTDFVAFQNNRKSWRIVYSVADVGEGVAVIHIGTSPIPHLVGHDRTGNIFWYENPLARGEDPRRPSWTKHYIGPGNVGNSVAVTRIGNRDALMTASNEHEGPGGSADARGITWYEQPEDPTKPWMVHPVSASYRDVHEINSGSWNGGIPYFIVAEQENACNPARPEGKLPSHPGVGCRISMFQWRDGKMHEAILAHTSTHNQAVVPWQGGLLMADANHGAYGARKDIHIRYIAPSSNPE